jgi:hypothetical protein
MVAVPCYMSSLVRRKDKRKCAEYKEKVYFLQSAFAYVHGGDFWKSYDASFT